GGAARAATGGSGGSLCPRSPRPLRTHVPAGPGGFGGGSGRRRAAGGLGPLAADPAALPLGEPAPDAELLAVGQCVLEALLTHDAAPSHLLGLSRGRAPFWEEQIRVDAKAV